MINRSFRGLGQRAAAPERLRTRESAFLVPLSARDIQIQEEEESTGILLSTLETLTSVFRFATWKNMGSKTINLFSGLLFK